MRKQQQIPPGDSNCAAGVRRIRRRLAAVVLVPLVFQAVGCAGPPRFLRLRERGDKGITAAMPDQPNAYGYLQDGPVFAGSQPSSIEPTATERVVTLQQEVDQLRIAKAQLEQTEIAHRKTIASQEETLAQAEKQLAETMLALKSAHLQFSAWQTRLDKLHGHVQLNERSQRRSLDELDKFVTLLIARRSEAPPIQRRELPVTESTEPATGGEMPPLPLPEEPPARASLKLRGVSNDDS